MRTFILLALAFVVTSSRAEMISDVAPVALTPVEKNALTDDKIHRLPYVFTPYNLQTPREPHRVGIFADRKVYLADDPVGQFLVYFIGQDTSSGVKLVIEVLQGDKVVGSKEISPVAELKYTFLLNIGDLAPGSYRLRARLVGGNQFRTIPDYEFEKSKERHNKVTIPSGGIPLFVHSQTNVPNGTWPITTGIPLPRGLTDSANGFVLLENGRPVPAQFNVRAWWYPNHTQVKWLGLDFVAKYDKGKPREYRIVQKKTVPVHKETVKVEQSADTITIDTGKLRFTVNRKHFAGIENATLDGKPFVGSGGGAYLVDEKGERYEAVNDENAVVELEQQGPVRATIRATGWYVSAKTKEKLCIFHTLINAYAGEPNVHVTHRTIITYDTHKGKKLADVGFTVKPVDASGWALGADGKVSGDLPPSPSSVWLHQDRWDHCRLMNGDKSLGEEKKSDGWMTEILKSGTLTVALRNLWQLYPKEFELSRDAMTLHFWPKDGHAAFTDAEALSRLNIHKIFYAHEGSLLDLTLPAKYAEAMKKISPMLERQQENAEEANGQGLVIGNDFELSLQEGTKTDGVAAQAALFQQDPHAIADPAWISKTEVEGRFAPVNRKRFPNVEKVLNEGYRGSHASVDLGGNYGMWIWPDTHNNWDPASKLPEWHRIWINTHYQGAWGAWLQYLRSGDPWMYTWARDNTDHVMNVSTINYDDPKAPLFGHMVGAMYHVKGFLPWGSEEYGHAKGDDYVEVSGHFVNPDTFIIRWLLLGDVEAKELMEEWGRAINRVSLQPERSRETCTTLGEMLSYYSTTFDPQALLYIKDGADEMMSRPLLECALASSPDHPFFHQQWIRRYWELTRDRRIVDWVKDYYDGKGVRPYGMLQVSTLLYQWTGDKNYLTPSLSGIALRWQYHYWNPGDPLDGFGLGCVERSWFPQSCPYYLQALEDAGIDSLPTEERDVKVLPKTVPMLKGQLFSSWGWMPGYGPQQYYLQPKGSEPVVQLSLAPTLLQWGTVPKEISNPSPIYVRVSDADGKVLLETSILHGSQRPTAMVSLDARKNKSPWVVYKNGGTLSLQWEGTAESMVIGPSAAAVTQESK